MINSRNTFSHNNPNSAPASRESSASSSETMPAFDPQNAQNLNNCERSAEQQLQDHKDRLTKSLLHNQGRYIGTQEVPQVTEQERKVIYDDINQDPAQTTAYASQIIQKIQMPSQRYGVETVFSENDSKYARRFLAIFNNTPDSAANMAQINAANLSQLLDSCPTPLEFDVHKQAFLNRMSQVNTPEKVSEYAQGLDQFSAHIYGKRYEYAEAFRAIQRDAAQYAAQKNYRAQVVNSMQRAQPTEHQLQEQQSAAWQDSLHYQPPEVKGQSYHETPPAPAKKPGLFGKLFSKKK